MKAYYSLLVMALLVLSVMPVLAEEEGSVPVEAAPGNSAPSIYLINKQVTIDNVNAVTSRTGMYLFTGEIITETVIVRDPNGIEDINQVRIIIVGEDADSICIATSSQPSDGSLSSHVPGGFDSATDKRYRCNLEAQSSWYGEEEITIEAEDNSGTFDGSGIEQSWWFNPAISLSVGTSNDDPITFEDGTAGDLVYSENKMIVKNTAEGGVNLWMYITGTNLVSDSSVAMCPSNNILDINNMRYRGNTGTVVGNWHTMREYDNSYGCGLNGPDINSCYAIGGAFNAVPDDASLGENILTNGATLEIQFRLEYPMPCIGNFNQGTITVIGKAI